MEPAARDVVRGTGIAWLARWLGRVSEAIARGNPWGNRRSKALAMLSSSEKALIRRFLVGNTRTIHVSYPSGAFGLELAEIVSIYRDPERAESAEPFGLVIHAWAWDHLVRYPELIGDFGYGRSRGAPR
jgi:hypothetical protein